MAHVGFKPFDLMTPVGDLSHETGAHFFERVQDDDVAGFGHGGRIAQWHGRMLLSLLHNTGHFDGTSQEFTVAVDRVEIG